MSTYEYAHEKHKHHKYLHEFYGYYDNPNPTIRKSSRNNKPPIWHKDYVLTSKIDNCKYLISNYVTYENLSEGYKCFLTKISNIKEPITL